MTTTPTDCTPTDPDVDGNLESYFSGNKKPWTIEMAQRQCRNIKHLANRIKELDNNVNPEFRSPESLVINEDASYGIVLNEGDNQYEMGHSITDGYTDFLTDTSYLDQFLTTAHYNGGTGKITIPQTNNIGASTVDVNNYSAIEGGFRWYDLRETIGASKSCPESVYPNPFELGMPSKMIAEVFPCGQTGLLNQLIVGLDTGDSVYWNKECWVEIWTVDGSNKPLDCIWRQSRVMGTAGGANSPYKDAPYNDMIVQNPPNLTDGTNYALVFRGGRTPQGKLYVQGYSDLDPVAKLTGSQVWYTDDNGQTWYKKGTETNSIDYHGKDKGLRDVQFQTFIKTPDATPYPSGNYYAYWKAYKTNGPITSVTLNPSFNLNSQTITWEVSSDFQNWHAVTSGGGWSHTFTGVETGKHTIYVRATLSSTNTSQTPEISGLEVTVAVDSSLTGYMLTNFYNPEFGPVQGGMVWSRINAPNTFDPPAGTGMAATVEIVHGTPITERFTFDADDTTFTLAYYPSEPLIHVRKVASGGTITDYTEEKNYTVDYTTGANAKKGTFITAPGAGTIEVTYYPLLLKGLTAVDFQDEDGNFVGLKLDTMTESFTATASQTEFILQTQAVIPLQGLTVDNVVKIENADYSVEYLNIDDTDKPPQTIITFPVGLTAGQVVDVDYSPNLKDSALALAYRLSRDTAVDKQVYVQPWWFQCRA